jgi:type III secretory pathway component EscV
MLEINFLAIIAGPILLSWSLDQKSNLQFHLTSMLVIAPRLILITAIWLLRCGLATYPWPPLITFMALTELPSISASATAPAPSKKKPAAPAFGADSDEDSEEEDSY